MASGASPERIRAVSKALFGSGTRLGAAAFVADNERVYARQVAQAIQIAENEAGRELRHFSDAGLLSPPTEPAGGRNPQIYVRRDSSFWQLAKQLLSELEDSGQ